MYADPEPGLCPILKKDNKNSRVSDPDSIWPVDPDLGKVKKVCKKMKRIMKVHV
jgi:hypothetical protein